MRNFISKSARCPMPLFGACTFKAATGLPLTSHGSRVLLRMGDEGTHEG